MASLASRRALALEALSGVLAPTTATSGCPGSTRTISITWTTVTHANSYNIKYSTSSSTGPFNGTVANGRTGTSYTWSSASYSTSYYIVVVAVDNNWTSTSTAAVKRTINSAGTCS